MTDTLMRRMVMKVTDDEVGAIMLAHIVCYSEIEGQMVLLSHYVFGGIATFSHGCLSTGALPARALRDAIDIHGS